MTLQAADLLTQLAALIASGDSDRADAEHWRQLKRRLAELGFGPRITLDDIIRLLPDPICINEILANSQEVQTPAAPAPKSARTHVTDDLRRQVTSLHKQGIKNIDISAELGIAKSTITRILADGRP